MGLLYNIGYQKKNFPPQMELKGYFIQGVKKFGNFDNIRNFCDLLHNTKQMIDITIIL